MAMCARSTGIDADRRDRLVNSAFNQFHSIFEFSSKRTVTISIPAVFAIIFFFCYDKKKKQNVSRDRNKTNARQFLYSRNLIHNNFFFNFRSEQIQQIEYNAILQSNRKQNKFY